VNSSQNYHHDTAKRTYRTIIYEPRISVMENQTTDYHGDVTLYQWNHTAEEGDAEAEYYLPNWTDLGLAGLFTILIIVTIVSIIITFNI